MMVPLSAQDPALWRRDLIRRADMLLADAVRLAPDSIRTLQARLQACWCARAGLSDPAPWGRIRDIYDALLLVRDDPIVRLNRAVAVAELDGAEVALAELDELDGARLAQFGPYHAVRADLLARSGRSDQAREAYEAVLALDPPPAERQWLTRRLAELTVSRSPAGHRRQGGDIRPRAADRFRACESRSRAWRSAHIPR
jgi:RNA polymerase sigma-70 factor (ECF subfamily)